MSEKSSPDGSLIAAVYTQDGGATSALFTSVSIRGRRTTFKNRDEKSEPLTLKHGHGVDVRWISNTELEVILHGEPQILFQAAEIAGVSIRYTKSRS